MPGNVTLDPLSSKSWLSCGDIKVLHDVTDAEWELQWEWATRRDGSPAALTAKPSNPSSLRAMILPQYALCMCHKLTNVMHLIL